MIHTERGEALVRHGNIVGHNINKLVVFLEVVGINLVIEPKRWNTSGTVALQSTEL